MRRRITARLTRPLRVLCTLGRLAYGTDQGRWLMEQVQSAPDGAKRRASTRPQHAFHDPDSLLAPPTGGASAPAAAPPADALSVRQGALSAGSDQKWMMQPRVLLVAGAAACFLLLIFFVSR